MIIQAIKTAAKKISDKKLKAMAKKYMNNYGEGFSQQDVNNLLNAVRLYRIYKKTLKK